MLVLLASLQVKAQTKALQLGDSWTAFAGATLSTYCKGATTINQGTSSSTASHWITGSCPDLGEPGACNMTQAFASGTGFTHVVISIGGNDFLDTDGCMMKRAAVKAQVSLVVNAARQAGPAGMRILLVGYCMPTQPVADCEEQSRILELNGGIAEAAAAAADVTYLDGTYKCGGTESTWSPGTHHQDSIHLNAKGYCNFWTMPATQSALDCGVASYDCDAVAATPVEGTEGEERGFAIEQLSMSSIAGIIFGGMVFIWMCYVTARMLCSKQGRRRPSSGEFELKIIEERALRHQQAAVAS